MATRGETGLTQASVRSTNLQLVLGAIQRGAGAVSRADIAAQLGMTRSTVSRLVDDLVLGRLVAEGTAVSGARGRPAVPLAIRAGTVVSLGLEINVERLVATVVDLAGNLIASVQRTVEVRDIGTAEAMRQLAGIAGEALAAAPTDARIVGAVLALPGLVDRDGTTVLRAPNLGWDGLQPVADWDLTTDDGPLPLRIANDIDCSALTVLREQPGESFLYITGEVGIGSAISLAGQLLTGPHGWASELGHVCVDPHGVRCGCGATGCLETVVGQRALLHRAGQPDMEAYLAALEAGDQTAATVLDEVIVALGIAVGGALNLIDVTSVKLGGHLGLLEPWLAARLADEIHDRVLWSDHSTIEITTVAEAPLRAAMGAGLSALARVTNDPASWIEPLIDR